MTLEKIKKQSKNILIIFMILQPIFDIYYLYTDGIINLFKFSPATIIRMLFLIYLGVTSYLIMRKKINHKYLVIFLIVYSLYTIFHLYNATLFNSSIPRYQNYSFSKEVFYLIRMFCPLLLIFVTYEKKLEFKDIKKIVLSVYLIFSIVMIVTNLLGIAITSYADGDKIIKANFLTWFNPLTYQKYGYEYLASKGIFHMANQISGVMTMLLPLLIYIVFKEKFKILNMVTLFLTMLSMMMLGTRIASLGMLAVLIATIILYLFFKIIHKEKIGIDKRIVTMIIFIGLGLLFYRYTPVANRVYAEDSSSTVDSMIEDSEADSKYENLKKEIKELESKDYSLEEKKVVDEEIKKMKLDFIEENYEIYGMDAIYIINLYPYEEDPDFWFSMFEIPYRERADHRQIKEQIMKRVYKLNANKLDSLFGYSFARPRNAYIYMENDIYVHFFSIGIFGIILFILPYLFIVFYFLYALIKNKKNFNYLNITYVMCILLTYVIGYLTGNIFDEWIVTLFLGFVTGLLLSNVKKVKH